ncbi:gamma carbonic anhydrase family protein [Alteromonas ponticola]|uniref:Gamma carbonic anhydrase family protein n=1 Tax=Alteromonas aquimaris TaxID=2998417 RepID=A0ABT3P6S8_9ALTE|nr:gamma carbonic anhydrase family protein [Alteromonas aquimaris]MCW8108464.1 gamma carbonic anhydrase family protein [Alteromonas aquimaris]
MIYQLVNKVPKLANGIYIAPGAHIIGDVEIQAQASVWFNAVVRGDCDTITIGEKSNVQDGSVLHTDEGIPLALGKGVTVGHKAMLHGCNIGDYSLIGINAVILNKVTIGKYCIIGANTLITENTTIPDYSLVVGSPGKIIRTLDPAVESRLKESATHYAQNAQRYREQLTSISDPTTFV